MSIKTKATLIVWWIILFFWWWAVFVMSLIWNKQVSTDIINSPTKQEKKITKDNPNKTWNTTPNIKTPWTGNTSNTTWNAGSKQEKKAHTLKILSYSKILDNKTEKIFAFKYKKESWGTINYENYNNLNTYSKDLIYKLATKSKDFDLAIIPSEWFDDISSLSNVSFKIKAPWFDISSIFDYNFYKYVKDNNIKAIPFAIDPIVWYSAQKVSTYQTFKSWKDIILTSDRVSENGKIKKMPIFLGYDYLYLSYLENHKSLFPIFDYIYKYYIHKNAKEWVKLLKDFWTNIINKTFDFNLYKKLVVKYREYKFCKNNEKMCFILKGDSSIVYDFLSSSNFYKENALNIYKSFKIRPQNIKKTTLALNKSSDEYPARWYIIIINPNIDQEKLLIFLKTYIKMWKNDELPFYKNLISPFNWIKIKEDNDFLSKYIWRFITAENFWMWLKDNLSKKELNYLKWNINIDLLF